jgi:hypothetical protein
MSQWGQLLPLTKLVERFRLTPLSGPYLNSIKTAESCHEGTCLPLTAFQIAPVIGPRYRR